MDGLGALAQGFAGSLPGGLALGQRQQALQQEQQKMEAELRAQQAAAQRAAYEQKLSEFGKLTEVFKQTPDVLKADVWPKVAEKTNSIFGTTLDPKNYPQKAAEYMNAANDVIGKYQAKKLGFGDTVNFLTQLEGKLVAAGEKDAAAGLDTMVQNLQGVQDNRARVQENATREPAGARYIPEFLTRDLLKKGGLNDQQILEGQRNGTIPRKLTRDEAALIIAANKPAGKGKFDWAAFRSGTPGGGVNQAKDSLRGDLFRSNQEDGESQ